MTAYLLFDNTNKLRSVGTVVVSPLPAGWTTRTLTDQEWAGLRAGDLIYNAQTQTIVPSTRLAEQTNQTALQARIDSARADLLAIKNSATVTTNGVPVVQGLQVALKDVADILLDLGRLVINKLDVVD